MPEIGIASYTAQITLRKDGSIIEDIDLPSFANVPEKLKIYPLQSAMQNLSKHGYNRHKVSKEITYDRRKDILVWQFSQVLFDNGVGIEIKTIEISAHDGTVVREYHHQGFH